jgi:hypothetical protein
MNDRLVLFLTHRSAASSAGDTVAIALPCDPGGLVKNRTGESHQSLAAPSAPARILCPFLGFRFAPTQALIRSRVRCLGPQPSKLALMGAYPYRGGVARLSSLKRLRFVYELLA